MQKTARALQQSNPDVERKEKTKKMWQYFWKILFLFISGIMLVLANKIYLFHTLDEFKDKKKGLILDLIKYGIPCAIAYIGIDHSVHYLFDDWVDKNYLREDKYTDPVVRKRRSHTLVRWAEHTVYYICTTITGYILIKDTAFMPRFLGGHGSIYNLCDHRYLEEATIGMEIFYIVQMGKHAGRFFIHAFIKPEGSYYEYLLHHTLATFLILFSYTMDMWVIGIFVLWVHDFSDIALAVCRGYRECKVVIRELQLTFYGVGMVIWVGLRILIFSYCCVFASWYQCFAGLENQNLLEIEKQVFILPYNFMAFMLTCLLIMHIYWTYYICQSVLSTTSKGKMTRHSYD